MPKVSAVWLKMIGHVSPFNSIHFNLNASNQTPFKPFPFIFWLHIATLLSSSAWIESNSILCAKSCWIYLVYLLVSHSYFNDFIFISVTMTEFSYQVVDGRFLKTKFLFKIFPFFRAFFLEHHKQKQLKKREEETLVIGDVPSFDLFLFSRIRSSCFRSC